MAFKKGAAVKVVSKSVGELPGKVEQSAKGGKCLVYFPHLERAVLVSVRFLSEHEEVVTHG